MDITLTVKEEIHNWVDAVILAKPYVLNDTIICQTTVGTEEVESAAETGSFTLLPNPATDLIQINFTTPTTSPARLYLLDLTGKRLQSIHIPAGETGLSIATNELPPGSYFIQLLADGKPPETQKLIFIR